MMDDTTRITIYEIKHLFQPLANTVSLEYEILRFGLDIAHSLHILFLIIPILCIVSYVVFTVFNGSWKNTILRIGIVVTIIALGQYLAMHYLGYGIIDPFDPYVNNIDITLLRLAFTLVLDIAIFLVLYFEYVKDLKIKIGSKRIPIYLLALTGIVLAVNAPLLTQLSIYTVDFFLVGIGILVAILAIFILPVSILILIMILGALIIILGLFALPYLALAQLIAMITYATIDAKHCIKKYLTRKNSLLLEQTNIKIRNTTQ